MDPDVYVVEPPLPADASSLCLWKPGHHPPRLAIEVVSESTAEKDYGDGPDRYAASGTGELRIFDPLLAGPDVRGGPHRLQIWQRDPSARFRRVYAGEGPARSETLSAWLVVSKDGRDLRLADDAAGAVFWPTDREACDLAEAENARLREEIAVLKATSK